MSLRTWLGRPPPATGQEAAWLGPAVDALADLLDDPSPRTVWCIANSDAVPVDEVRARLDPGRDLLCQYNLCRHAGAFADPAVTSIFFFHMTDRGTAHGIAPDGTPRPEIAAFGPASRACYLRSGFCGDRSPPAAIGIPAFTLDTRRLELLLYRDRPGTIPSAGFASTLLFHLVNLRRALAGQAPHAIVLCGFTGLYSGGAFAGHDFHFEQAELAKLPNVTHLRTGATAELPTSRLHHDLAEVFHPGYDGQKRGKAEMLFDVAKLHLAAGDLPAFVDFTRMSAGINPGLSQLSWLVRTFETTPGGEAAGGPSAELDGLTRGLDRLRENWASGNASDLGGAAFASDITHGQAAYAADPGSRPRVLIVNETSKLAFNRWHLGCDLVSRTLVDRLAAHGLDCAGWVNGLAGLNRILAHDPEARFDGVVVNGEGTLHHDADRAFEIGTIGQYLKGLGKRVFLVNSVWQDNGPRLAALVRDFDLVAVRESRSAEALARVRPDVRLVPDLCWSAEFAPGQRDGTVAVLDCVDPERSGRLEAVARAAGLPFFVMDRFFDAFHRAVRDGCPPEQTPRVLHRADVGAPLGWIGGRFHGVVLALGAGVPIVSTPSNTSKVQALFQDIGLEDKLVTRPLLDRLRSRADVDELFASGPGAYSAADWARVADYRGRARAEIDRLFADIAASLG